ncbi:MAG: 2OG-Fe(II) oxygenase family protein [Actinomycetota bacterium]
MEREQRRSADSIEVSNERGFGGVGVEVDRPIPVISLADDPAAVDAALWDAASETGFFQVVDTGLDPAAVDDAFALAEAFFALPESVKEPLRMPPGTNSGWEYRSQRRPSTGTLDEKETYQVTRTRMDELGLWPGEDDVVGFAETLLAFERANWSLAMRILGSFARGLGFDDDFFADAHDPASAQYQSTLRLLHYLPLDGPIDEGTWRAGAHTDYDCLTLLHQRPGQSGLQVCPGAEAAARSGQPLRWTGVEPTAGTITCNIGDMLTRWSDDRLRSTLHRVKVPAGEDRTKPRYSIAFFAQANRDAVIEGPGGAYPPVTAAEFLQQRLAANFAAADAGAGSTGD